MRSRLVIILLIMVCFAASCKTEIARISLQIDENRLDVEVANTPELRRQGLMKRKSIPYNSGMLFVFPKDIKPSFWMKDTSLPLSIAFISSNGIIKQIEKLTPNTLNAVKSQRSIRYALEVNQGWFAEHGISPGDTIVFPDKTQVPKGY